jgi:hypothetical protein
VGGHRSSRRAWQANPRFSLPYFLRAAGSVSVHAGSGRLIGQKRPLKPKHVWSIRARFQLQDRKRDLALFNLAIDRACDLVQLERDDICAGGRVRERGAIVLKKPRFSGIRTVPDTRKACVETSLSPIQPQMQHRRAAASGS